LIENLIANGPLTGTGPARLKAVVLSQLIDIENATRLHCFVCSVAAYAEDQLTLEQLKAFTVTSDHARQERVWEQLA
jgi:hypothetical protein